MSKFFKFGKSFPREQFSIKKCHKKVLNRKFIIGIYIARDTFLIEDPRTQMPLQCTPAYEELLRELQG
jgi:hypothetical protein